jgi:Tfp pilus assembly protein PilE
MKHTIIAALLALVATPAWANPPGYDSSWTRKEAADAAMEADHAFTDCMFHHLWNYAKKTVEPARTVVKAAHAACWFEHTQLGSAAPGAGATASVAAIPALGV